MESKLLIVFLKNSDLGKVKTRIAKDCSNEEALSIYIQLCKTTFELLETIDCDIKLYYSDYISSELQDYPRHLQSGLDLGERMFNAFNENYKQYKSIVLIGTDCPYLTKEDIDDAFENLDRNEVVLGPCHDGGYYLIGLRNLNSIIFQDVEWSTDQVLPQTILNLNKANLSYSLLKTYSDIDTLEDWNVYRNNRH